MIQTRTQQKSTSCTRMAFGVQFVKILCLCFLFGLWQEAIGQTTFTKSISLSTDDVEEEGPTGIYGGPGYMYHGATTLELVTDHTTPSSGEQKIGLRFTGITIPKNATITNAYLTFTATGAFLPNTNTGTTNLTIKGQAADSPLTFSNTYYDVSNRTTTAASAAWSPNSWTRRINL
jgi:hypothetical protein